MTHLYLLSLDARWGETKEIKLFLADRNLISNLVSVTQSPDSQEETIMVEVPNKSKFERYLKIPNSHREPTDPGHMIKTWEHTGIKGKSAPSSKEGRLISTRIKRFKEEKRKAKKRSK